MKRGITNFSPKNQIFPPSSRRIDTTFFTRKPETSIHTALHTAFAPSRTNSQQGQQRPCIGITATRPGGDFFGWSLAASVWLSGAQPVFLSPGGRSSLKGLQGLMLSGGPDVDPRAYLDPAARVDYLAGRVPVGPAVPSPRERRYHSVPERDALEFRLLSEAMQLGLPILGVCRGLQLINVALGGTLHRDISALYPERRPLRSILPRKRIRLAADSPLRPWLPQATYRVNALHHQGIDDLAPELQAVAWEENGLIQAITLPGYPLLLGVQWHPELMPYQAGQRRLIAAVGKHATLRA